MPGISFLHPERQSTGQATRLLLLILLVAAALRFYQLGQPFTDLFSWRQASVAMMAENFYRVNGNILYPEVNWSGPGPNYQGREFQTVSYLAALLYRITGQEDWVGRTIAILFGLWGIFALYQLVRRVWGPTLALNSAAVMAVLPGSVIIERSFLPDPAMVALVTTSLWLWVAYLQSGERRYLALAGLIGTWGVCTKIPGLIVGLPALYAVVALWGWRQLGYPRKLFSLLLFAIGTLLPVVAYYLWARHLALAYPPYHFAGSGNWLWDAGLAAWWQEHYFLDVLQWHVVTWQWTLPVIILFGLGVLTAWPSVLTSQHGEAVLAPYFFHFWLLAGVIYYLLGAKELVENPWNLHIVNPVVAVFVGHALLVLATAAGRLARHPAAVGVVMLGLLLWIVVVGHRGLQKIYTPHVQEEYELGHALRTVTQPGDLVITIGSEYGDPVALYYSRRRGWGFPPPANHLDWSRFPGDDGVAIRLYDELRHQGADWFGIVTEHYAELWRDHPEFITYLDKTCVFQQQLPAGVICQISNTPAIAQVLDLPEPPLPPEEEFYVQQEVVYHRAAAGAVVLIWGIDGWNMVPARLRPEGTEIKNNVMYTPLTKQNDTFSTTVSVPYGVALDYGFLVTQWQDGSPANAWEPADADGYHQQSLRSGRLEIRSE